MIKVEGFMAFKGTMRITPKSDTIKPFEIEGDWLYKPDCDCWYSGGKSYPAKICTVLEVE